ncbi:MAG: thioredoxin-dependent thiol peroxidase [Chlorobi bacterium]|nr:MAG: peroxiredoxin [Chlorobi bacterium OLB7]MBK8912102.1 thioredoxin-dependent thiol peroxidase [Chlorobiota bacterium]MBX7217123.1 thioredoxin-dependent thiol peroxidase [Candidatus Kapabacteria bacterium]
MLNVGDLAPDFTAQDQDGITHRLKQYRGRTVVLYFYPKDLTSGCTTQACDFRDNLNRLAAQDVVLLGASPDTVKSHRKFADKESLNFPLLADPEKEIVNRYQVWVEKSMYGRKYMGVERTTFIIDKRGKIKHIFPKVKVNGHVQEVLDALAN